MASAGIISHALYVGRFRIFHRGYLEVVRYILGQGHPELIIAIGAAQQCCSLGNPFSGEERAEMISRVLEENGLACQTHIVQIDESFATYENWAKLVESLCPPFHLVYSHDELVRLLFQRLGYQTSPVPQFTQLEYSFETVTRKMVNHEPWQDLLPTVVSRLMEQYKLEQRIKELYSGR